MRILIWHGYLLNGTGSNVYTRALARALTHLGHEVVVLSQDADPSRFDLGSASFIRPEISTRLPVFVLDNYPDLTAALLQEMPRAEVEQFVAQNAAAVKAAGPADLLITNHVLLGGPVGAASGLPYIVKAHGSELEFSMRGNSELCAWARDSLDGAAAVLAGSGHIAGVLSELLGDFGAPVSVIPPGVDVEQMHPEDHEVALAALVRECQADPPNPNGPDHDERRGDSGNAARLAEFLARGLPTISYVGKLSAEKGVDLLLQAVADLPVQVVVVGFGPARAELEEAAGDRVLFTGPLEHRHLEHLWPLMRASVVPSVAPEAFGMVAAEAASCGVPPVVANHSGLAEIASGLRAHYPADLGDLISFRSGDVADLRRVIAGLLDAPDEQWEQMSAAARNAVVELWSWESVATSILDLPRG